MNTIDIKRLYEILPTVVKPGRYLGNEWNVIKKDLDKAAVRFALAFPDIYDVGMSYLGFRIIYGVLNSMEDVACERVFTPWPDFEDALRKNAMPLFSLESRAPLKDFDIIGFSLTYELNYTNVLNMLDLAGIPVLAAERGQNFPLIIAGGPIAQNPAPMADFIDAFVIGEGEEVVLEVVDAYRKTKNQKSKTKNEEILKELSNIEGVYVPRFPKEVKKRIVNDLDKAFYPVKEIVPNVKTIHDRITLEIMRGCPFNCKFCQAGAIYKPVRLRSQQRIIELAKAIYADTGYDEISLLSLSTSAYPRVESLISALINEFEGMGVGVSLPSLRSQDALKLLPPLDSEGKKNRAHVRG
ncbi:MAG: radical SAM protein [Candidatus Omnitrophica bacterium]|nr:radical SAM protein [Candidatus Omnitrophota bacterium]